MFGQRVIWDYACVMRRGFQDHCGYSLGGSDQFSGYHSSFQLRFLQLSLLQSIFGPMAGTSLESSIASFIYFARFIKQLTCWLDNLWILHLKRSKKIVFLTPGCSQFFIFRHILFWYYQPSCSSHALPCVVDCSNKISAIIF